MSDPPTRHELNRTYFRPFTIMQLLPRCAVARLIKSGRMASCPFEHIRVLSVAETHGLPSTCVQHINQRNLGWNICADAGLCNCQAGWLVSTIMV